MTDEEIQREREEAERLIREINATIDRINCPLPAKIDRKKVKKTE